MKEKIYPENAHLIDTAVKAMEEAGVTRSSPHSGEVRTAPGSPLMGLPALICVPAE